ncbi:MAG: hypothetical protein K1Y02_04455 [Candidatus Hydrogenedentes bacterium]|nr:hypothetical protein [Candidatus Hydrogenedentota bacterium]
MTRRTFLVSTLLTAVLGCAKGGVPKTRVHTWGHSGKREGTFQRPRALMATSTELYVADTTGRIQVFDHEGIFKRKWSMPSAENGTPTSITLAADGRVIIPDTHYSRIMEYSPEGTLQRQWGSSGTGNGEFVYPTDIVEAPDGTLYLSEYGTGAERVHIFDGKGNFLRQWGKHGENPGEFSRPMAITFAKDTVYVCDTANHRVQCFSPDGKHLHTISEAGDEPGRLKFPHDLALAPGDSLIVCEYGNNRLSIFGLDGTFRSCVGGPGREPGLFAAPRGVAVSPNGYVFIADTDNDRIQRLLWEDVA